IAPRRRLQSRACKSATPCAAWPLLRGETACGAFCPNGNMPAMPQAQAAGRSINYQWIDGASGKPTLVFLHEGLGSIRQWRDFPAKVAAATGSRALVYDRYGYGQSDVLAEDRRTVQFMHDEALLALPELLKALGVKSPVLIGHSDGASIALIHAGA